MKCRVKQIEDDGDDDDDDDDDDDVSLLFQHYSSHI